MLAIRSTAKKLCFSLAILITLGCRPEPPHSVDIPFEGNEVFVSRCGDKEFHFSFFENDAQRLPSWQPGILSKVSLDKLAVLASRELPKYSRGFTGWEFSEITLNRLHSGALKDKCVFIVRFTRPNTQDSLEIPVTMDGAVSQGIEHPLDKRRYQE
jgi:hypothetical protein